MQLIWPSTLKKLADRRILVTLLLGFSSGLPLALTGATLQAWCTTEGLDIKTLGFLGMVSFPYTFKFLWAPLMDRLVPPFLGRRRGWILITQMLLIVTMLFMSTLSPKDNLWLFGIVAVVLAFLSASQDIAIDAYRADMLPTEDRALGAGMSSDGYRTAMLVSGGGALVLAQFLDWQLSYTIMASLMGIGVFATFWGPQPLVDVTPPRTIKECVIDPFVEFMSRPHSLFSSNPSNVTNTITRGSSKKTSYFITSLVVLLFIVSYKMGDAFTVSFRSRFLLKEVGFSLATLGSLVKIVGFTAVIIGITWGGLITARLGFYRALLIFGLFQAISNLGYMILLWTGPDYFIGSTVIFLDELLGGMGSAAYGGLVLSLCNPRFTAFQMALLTALSSLGRVFISPLAATIIDSYGWETFYLSSLIVSSIGLGILLVLRGVLQEMIENVTQLRANFVPAKA